MAAPATSTTVSRVVLGPLTTTYTQPPGCSIFVPNPSNDNFYQGQGCDDVGDPVDTSSCWPPALISATPAPYLGWGFYSPGLICPSGYTSACTAALNSDGSPLPITTGTSFNFQFPLTAGETAVGCCPSGFTCAGGTQTCQSTVTSGSFEVGRCGDDSSSIFDFVLASVHATNTLAFDTSTYTTSLASAILYAPMFALYGKALDNGAAATSTAATISGASATAGGTTTASTGSSSSLSTGAIVALAVVIPLVVIGTAIILARWFYKRRQQNQTSDPSRSAGPQPVESDAAEIPAKDSKYELPASERSQELGTEGDASAKKSYQAVPQELPA